MSKALGAESSSLYHLMASPDDHDVKSEQPLSLGSKDFTKNSCILWIIPARSGSKGLPDKNIRMLGGIPLLAWRILQARKLGGEIWVSTDSQKYADIAVQYGAQVPFLRPPELATDEVTSAAVCLHALKFAERMGKHFAILGLLQPTSPFISAESLQRGLDTMEKNPQAHAVLAVCTPPHPGFLIQEAAPTLKILAARLRTLKSYCRQFMPPEMMPCGGFYFVHGNRFLEKPDFYDETSIPVFVQTTEALDIDSEMDFAFAEFLLASGRIQYPEEAEIVDAQQAGLRNMQGLPD